MDGEKRVRKKTVVFDPHPPGSKHQMMSHRSKKVKDKKVNKIRMRKAREENKLENVGEEDGGLGNDVEGDPAVEQDDGQSKTVDKEPAGQKADEK